MNEHADLYCTEADVLRAGIYALDRWRKANPRTMELEENVEP